jgi:hypothetical protein
LKTEPLVSLHIARLRRFVRQHQYT